MENLEIILSLIGTTLGLAITVLTFIIRSVRNSKVKKSLEQAVKIGNAVLPFVREAEKFTSFSGAEKKAYVMTKANQFAIQNKILFSEELVSQKVEELVELTKQVNVKSRGESKAFQEITTPAMVAEITRTIEQPEFIETKRLEANPVEVRELAERKSWL